MTPLTVLYESPVVDDKTQLKWIVTAGDNDTFTVRKVKSGVETVEQTGIRTIGRAKEIVQSKVSIYRAFQKGPKR